VLHRISDTPVLLLEQVPAPMGTEHSGGMMSRTA